MANSVFPNGIVSFTTKRNLLDDVDASDINKMQNEIIAIEESIGEQNNKIALLTQEEINLAQQEGALAQNLEIYEAQTAFEFNTLNDKVEYYANGSHIPAFRLEMNTAVSVGTGVPGVQVGFTTSTLSNSNINGVTWGQIAGGNVYYQAPKSGFWSLQGTVHYNVNPGGSPFNSADGEYNASIYFNGVQSHAFNRDYYNHAQTPGITHVLVDVSIQTWLNAGDLISLFTSQYSAAAQSLGFASLSGFWVRGY